VTASFKVPLGAGGNGGLPVMQPQRPDWHGMLADQVQGEQRPPGAPPAA
jgi:hypothetical protein